MSDEAEQLRQTRMAILERRMLETTASDLRHRQIFELLPTATLVLNAEGMVIDGNLAAAHLLGVEIRFLVGKPLVVFLRSDQHSRFYTHRQQVLEGRDGKAISELILHRRDGEEFPIRLESVHFPERAGNRCLLSVLTDLREHRRAEQALVAARRSVEEMAKAKGALMDNMTHELRTPLNGIIGMLRLLVENLKSPEHLDLAQTALNATSSLTSLVDDVLDFSRLESGYSALEQVPLSIRALAEDALAAIASQANQKDLQLILTVDRQVPERLTGDPSRLRQVLINLLGNAVKFTVKGFISLEITLESPTGDIPTLVMAIRDSGPGIPADRQNRIFERFEQGDSSLTRSHGGSGLGLALVREILRLMHGRTQVESAVGFGTCFTLRIPTRIIEGPGPIPVIARTGDGSWILCENRELTRRSLIAGLERYHLKVVPTLTWTESLFAAGPRSTILAASHLVPDEALEDPRLVLYGPQTRPRLILTPLLPSRLERLVRERCAQPG